MERLVRRFTFPLAAACLFLAQVAALSQISITAPDVRSALHVGAHFRGFETDDTNPVPVTVGTASSSPQTWDLRSLEFTETNEMESIDPASSPHIASFPAADVVLRVTMLDQSSTTYQYMQITPEKFLLHGLAFSDDTTREFFTPPMVQMTFPCTYGTTWVYRSDPYSPVPGITLQSTETWTCDAFGTLRLPHGDFPALRLLNESVIEVMHPLGSSLSTSYTYSFVTSSIEMASVSMDSTEFGKSEVLGTVSYTSAGGTSHGEGTPPAPVFRVGAPYPQPATHSVRIPLSTEREGRVQVSILDMIGREVSSLPAVNVPTGSHELVWVNPGLPAGRYLCAVRGGGAVTMRSLIIVR